MKRLELFTVTFFLFSITVYSEQKDSTMVPKPEVKPSGKLWGYAFGDFSYKAHANSLNMNNTQYAGQAKDYSAFEFRRIYLGYDYDISEKFTSQLILAYEGGTLADGTRSIIIKAANVRWKNIFPNSDLIFGQMATPTYATVSEPVWGYRSLEKTIMDMRGIGASSDAGIALQGKFNRQGDYGYTVMIGNGSGTKTETNKFKKFYGDLYAKFMNQKILLDIGADNEGIQNTPYQKNKTTIQAFLAYQSPMITAGIEAFQQIQKNNTVFTEQPPSALHDTVNSVASGISVFARVPLIKDKLMYVLRYDYYNPDSKFKSDNIYSASYPFFKESFALAALDYTPQKNIHIMPNIWYDRYNNKATSQNNLAKNGYDLVPRLTVYYIFR